MPELINEVSIPIESGFAVTEFGSREFWDEPFRGTVEWDEMWRQIWYVASSPRAKCNGTFSASTRAKELSAWQRDICWGLLWELEWHKGNDHLASTSNSAAETVQAYLKFIKTKMTFKIWRAGPNSIQLIALKSHQCDSVWGLSWITPTRTATARTISYALANGELKIIHFPYNTQPTIPFFAGYYIFLTQSPVQSFEKIS